MSNRIFEVSGITTTNFSDVSEIEIDLKQAAGEVACIEIVRVISNF